MPYTLWHCGVLIGETDFEGERDEHGKTGWLPRARRHLVGVFRPTSYGRDLLPRLCGILTAGADLQDELTRRGVDADNPPPELMEELFENTAAGAHIIDIGRVLSEVELRAPTGSMLEVASMGFIELAELAALSRRIGCQGPMSVADSKADVPEFLVSVTLRRKLRRHFH